ncbi:unnamed protein product [Trypanosoma congolense IL3000]|uniref:WGS project CAEQ00000000 data, annotated contig 2081 n=1 Tax=Trypanosoma congolense (strain IL3000) TaxID=1068625 RepID=F9WBA3_TRYCI|nr:unnamed protein product [Trypanosoma congolense IL3000]
MVPPKYVESPCFPIHSIVRRFDLTAGGGSVGTVMQRVGTQPPSVTRASDGGIIQGTMDLVLFPCQLGDPTRPTGWPPAGQQDFTVMVNESYVTSGFPRCPTRSASHRTLAGLPLSPFLPRAPDGTIAPEAQLKICVVSRGKWTATFLLAWCGVVEIDTVVERTVSRLIKEQRATPRQEDLSDSSSASASGVPGSVEDSDIDIDSGWVDDAVDGAKQPGGSGEVCGMGSSGCAADRTSGHDPGVDDGEAVVTLRCPLSYSRIQMAGRGRHCTHLACFDVVTFVKSCLRSNSWNCPICDGPILIDDVRMDRTVQAAIDSLGPDEYSVVLFGRGYKEWRRNDCVPCVSDDDDECESTRGVDLSSDYHQSPLKSALE